jgi:RNA polymerase sigma-70 factor (ECF subfamily)
MADPAEGLESSPDRYRNYLRLLARVHLDRRLQGQVDPSDIVQETLLKAHTRREQFRGQTQGEWEGWLRTILVNELQQALRRALAGKRDLALERSLEASLTQTSLRLERWLAAQQSSPSEQAVHHEELLRLADALAELRTESPAQADAVELHHLKGQPIAEVAQALGRSEAAAASLIQRGLKKLRAALQGPPEE